MGRVRPVHDVTPSLACLLRVVPSYLRAHATAGERQGARAGQRAAQGAAAAGRRGARLRRHPHRRHGRPPAALVNLN
eukprot:scaffold98556_cov75-Phaeocystis_antarctica.AAC.1